MLLHLESPALFEPAIRLRWVSLKMHVCTSLIHSTIRRRRSGKPEGHTAAVASAVYPRAVGGIDEWTFSYKKGIILKALARLKRADNFCRASATFVLFADKNRLRF